MVTMWIILSVATASLVGWRLRKASATLDRILRDDDVESEAETLPAAHDR
jgi:hypothetical protein